MAIVLCECEALATHRLTYLGSFFLDPEDVRELSLGAIWNFIKGTGQLRGTKVLSKAYAHRNRKGQTHYWFIFILNDTSWVNTACYYDSLSIR
jgi:hypothetical protein